MYGKLYWLPTLSSLCIYHGSLLKISNSILTQGHCKWDVTAWITAFAFPELPMLLYHMHDNSKLFSKTWISFKSNWPCWRCKKTLHSRRCLESPEYHFKDMYLVVVVVVVTMTCRPQKEWWTESLHLTRRRGMDDNGGKVNIQHHLWTTDSNDTVRKYHITFNVNVNCWLPSAVMRARCTGFSRKCKSSNFLSWACGLQCHRNTLN